MKSTPDMKESGGTPQRRKRLLWSMLAVAAGMLGFAFINVPLFRIFCTHIGLYVPADQKLAASAGPVDQSRSINVMFTGISATGLAVTLQPGDPLQQVHIGERHENRFTFTNTTDRPLRFRAIHDIYPDDAALHLALIQCFCFSDQTLGPHETKTLPVIYQVNAGLSPDVGRMSLIYTLEPLAPAAPAPPAEPGTNP